MRKHKWSRVLIAILLVALVGSSAGCVTISVPDESDKSTSPTSSEETAAVPIINSFDASPKAINPGQSVTLSWNVSNATTVTIQPSAGSVGPSGTAQASPATTTTYTLTATNPAGSQTSSITVTVTATPAAAGKPDLVITDIWLAAKIVYYKIKNQGNADAKNSKSYLYVNGLREANGHAAEIAAGEEITESFTNYQWNLGLPSSAISGDFDTMEDILTTYLVKICADVDNVIAESDEGNNCSSTIWGEKFTYDFVERAHLATWRSSAGKLKWPMVASDRKGAAFMSHFALEDGRSYANGLATYPHQASHGSIQGNYGYYYVKLGETRSREIVIPYNAKFSAKVGFRDGATATDGATVAFGYVDVGGNVVFLEKLDIYYDGTLDICEVDLSDIEGKKVYFILRVEANDSWEQDWVVWIDPKIVQESEL